MDKSDWYAYAPIFAMIGWSIIHKTFLTAVIDDNTAQQIGIALLIAPMILLEVYFKHITSGYNYIRATVRPHNKVLRFYIESFEEFKGEIYTRREITTHWPTRTHYHGKVSKLNIIFKGDWNHRLDFKTGRARLYEYEVDHRGVENIVLNEFLEGTLEYYRTKEIPNYLLVNASGDYYREMALIDYTEFEEEKEEAPAPAETEPPEQEGAIIE